MRLWGHLVLLPWALCVYRETQSVPARSEPVRTSDAIERFATYEACDKAAQWAEAQTDLHEEWTVTKAGQRFHTTMTFECRQGGR